MRTSDQHGWACRFLLCAVAGGFPSSASTAFSVDQPGMNDRSRKASSKGPALTKPPELIRSVEPVYPEEAKTGRLTGDVTMEVEIDENGGVANVRVVKPAGHGFDAAAVEAVRQFRFSPAEIDGKPATVRISYTLHFIFSEPSKPPSPGPRVSIRGSVLERGRRHPVVGASVRIEGAEAVTTDAKGEFTLHAPPGTVEVSVVEPRYVPFKTQETLRPREELQVTYYLMPKVYGLYETVVTGLRERKEVVRRTLEREELRKVPGSLGDPIRVLLDLPGVARGAWLSGQLVVRGASPLDTGAYFDSVEVPLLYHFNGGPSVINPEFLDRIDFFPGGFGAEYGRAIGGIVNIQTRSPKEREWHGSGKIDLIDSGAFLMAPLGEDWTVSVAARRSYIDLILPLVLRITHSSASISPRYYDYQVRVDYRPKNGNSAFKLFLFGSDDQARIVTGGNTTTDFQFRNHTAFARLVGSWSYQSGRLSSLLEPYLGPTLSEIGTGVFETRRTDWTGGLREKLEFAFNSVLAVHGGLDVALKRLSLGTKLPASTATYRPFPGESTANADLRDKRQVYISHDLGAWLEGEANFPSGWKILPSLRVDPFLVRGQTRFSADPRLVVRYQIEPTHATTLKGSVGLYHELPPVQFLDPETGNPHLPLQAALQTSVGFERTLTEAIRLDITGFYNRRSHLAERSRDVLTDSGSETGLRRENYDGLGRGRAYGFELFLRHELTERLFGWLAYTLSWSKARGKDDASYHFTNTDQRHILILIGQYKFGRGWELGGRYRLVSGNPTTPYQYATFDADTGNYRPFAGALFSKRLSTFSQLDLRVDKTWLYNRWSLGVYLDVQNVLNQKNKEFLLNDYRYRTQEAIPSIPIFPTLGVRGSF